MAVVKELIRSEANGTISFGDYTLPSKTKVEDYEAQGNLYKVKTFSGITKLERDGMFVYESVPGTAVEAFSATEEEMSFHVYGPKDAEITVELEAGREYKVYVNDLSIGDMKTNLSGKLTISAELSEEKAFSVMIVKNKKDFEIKER